MNKEDLFKKNLQRLGIHQKDIIERFIKSSGKGGQNVNKTSTRVYLKHIPTGIVVKYQGQRSQAQNRYTARLLLLGKIEKYIARQICEEKNRIEKIDRKSRKRSMAAKLKTMEKKRKHSRKKLLRAKI